MSKFFPFRGYRYADDRAGDLSKLVTQPYDKISPEMLDSYLGRSRNNVAHVILNPDYRDAGRKFGDWIETGVLIQDPTPSVYPYRQEFTIEGRPCRRLGLVGLVSLDRAQQRVKGHETVLQAPLEDRLQLIRQTESNDGLIFSLYSEARRRVDSILEEFCAENGAVADLVDDYGTRHTLWRLSQPELLADLSETLSQLTFYIADGHHRFETAVRFARQCRDKGWSCAAVESFDKRMMALFNMESEGISILPTHRAVRDLSHFDGEAFLAGLRKHFQVSPLADDEQMASALSGDGQRLAVVLAEPLSRFLIEPGDRLPPGLDTVQGPSRNLDVNLLHRAILEPLLGIGETEITSQKHVDYFRSRDEMTEQIRNGRYQLGFVLNPTRLGQVKEISERGERMPQKSTDFYPKLLTGLVFMKMAIHKAVNTPR